MISSVQTSQTADSSAKRFAAGLKLQIDLLEISVSPRLLRPFFFFFWSDPCLVTDSKMSMDLDAPVYMSGLQQEQPTAAT